MHLASMYCIHLKFSYSSLDLERQVYHLKHTVLRFDKSLHVHAFCIKYSDFSLQHKNTHVCSFKKKQTRERERERERGC